MTEVIEPTSVPPPAETPAAAAPDLATAAQCVLAASDEPLTVSKLRARLPAALRGTDLKDLGEVLERQVAANVLYKYPKYRSQQDRYWDRGMAAHVAQLIRSVLEEVPLAWSELRRKLPAYSHAQAQQVLDEQLAQGLLHRHPRAASRGAERFGVRRPDPKDYLRQELPPLFTRLTALGFTRPQIRAAALELLHEEEWDAEPPAPPQPEASAPPAPKEERAAEPQVPLAGPHTPAVAQAETHPDTPDAARVP
ncbi:MAG TPA: hypothetical protein VKA46_03795 [Gemmataceae bacterium]|nr:hypothetical protein [Gemmataceae bacterium]